MSARADNKPIYHVYPVNDLREHSTEDFGCVCEPKFHVEQNGYVVTHNSFDMREHFERRT